METDSNLGLEHSLPEAGDITTEFLEGQLVGLALVDVSYGRFANLQREDRAVALATERKGCGGGIVVSIHAIYTSNQSSNPAGSWISFYCI